MGFRRSIGELDLGTVCPASKAFGVWGVLITISSKHVQQVEVKSSKVKSLLCLVHIGWRTGFLVRATLHFIWAGGSLIRRLCHVYICLEEWR